MEMTPSDFLKLATQYPNTWELLKECVICVPNVGDGTFVDFIAPLNRKEILVAFPGLSANKEGKKKKLVLNFSSDFYYGFPVKITLSKQLELIIKDLEQREKNAVELLQKEAEAKGRNEGIKYFCCKKNIKHLLHFTHVNNLHSILSRGIIDRKFLDSMADDNSINYRYSDEDRLDGHKEAISLSISFPNHSMFFKKRNSRKDWVVLLLKPSILWEFDCAFCYTNAASIEMKNLPLSEKKELSSLKKMFDDEPLRKKLFLSDCYTTDYQAEVLVFEHIPPEYITEVHFEDYLIMENWIQKHGDGKVLLTQNTVYFRKRSDVYYYPSIKANSNIKNADFFL